MNKLAVLIIAMGMFNMVLTYSCFEVQEHQFLTVAHAIQDAINMIDDNLNFEHKEDE